MRFPTIFKTSFYNRILIIPHFNRFIKTRYLKSDFKPVQNNHILSTLRQAVFKVRFQPVFYAASKANWFPNWFQTRLKTNLDQPTGFLNRLGGSPL